MSDAFSDLWSTSATTNTSKQSLAQQKSQLQASQSQSAPVLPPWASKASQSDAFSILAASSAGNTPRSTPPTRSPVPPSASTTARSSGDAFSGLVGFGSTGSTTGSSLGSIASLQARGSTPLQQFKPPVPAQDSALWDQLDSLGGGGVSSSKPAAATSDQDPWDFLSAPAAPPRPARTPPAITPQNTSSSSKAANVFDLLGDFGTPTTATAATSSSSLRPSPVPGQSRSASPAASAIVKPVAVVADEDDFWDSLNQPVRAAPERASPAPPERSSSSRPSPSPRPTATRNGSPPPHLIGQIIEMGFSVQQARAALASTPTGDDVQAALESLLREGPPEPEPLAADSDSEDERERERARRHAARRRGPQRDQAEAPARASPQPEAPTQADKLLAQASSFGLSVFSRANAMWNEGKERAQKLYEEQVATAAAQQRPSSSASGRQPASNGRPRWMPQEGEDDPTSPTRPAGDGTFKDSSDDEAPAPSFSGRPPTNRAPPAAKVVTPPVAQQPPASRKFVFDDSQPTGGYVSRNRRPQQSPAAPPPAAAPVRRPSPAGPVMPPAPTMPVASGSVLSTAAQHKTKANESFKLGAYPVAITSYGSALDVLPTGHMARIPLLTNRALASIRIGEWKSALGDCETVITMIRPNGSGPVYLGSVAGGGTNIEGDTLYLGDALLKGLSRRAAAREMGEKWAEALSDWEEVNRAATLPMTAAPGADVGKIRAEATRGVERCRKMISVVTNGADSTAAPPKPKPRPRPKANPLAELNEQPSAAVQRLREKNAAEANEDAEKSALKDGVDARLAAWRGGKENNIRALLASLDSVLWPELGWQTVGMAELISPKQLKIRYMKAIAKLHPDKLNVSNTTTEQRMIANGVFATLNDAWVAAGI